MVLLIFQSNAGHMLPRIIGAVHGNKAKNMATRMRAGQCNSQKRLPGICGALEMALLVLIGAG